MVRAYPDAIAHALSKFGSRASRSHSVLLGADAYTALSETSDHGIPCSPHPKGLVAAKIIWAPAIRTPSADDARRDFSLYSARRVDRYLSHDDKKVRLYLQETFHFSAADDGSLRGVTAGTASPNPDLPRLERDGFEINITGPSLRAKASKPGSHTTPWIA